MRETLGMGACQYLLEIEGLGSDGEITPQQTAEWVMKIVERKREARQADEIRRRLDQAKQCLAGKGDRLGAYEAVVLRIDKLCIEGAGSGNTQVLEAARAIRLLLGDRVTEIKRTKEGTRRSAGIVKSMAASCEKLLARIAKPDTTWPGIPEFAEQIRLVGEFLDGILGDQRMTMRRVKQLCRDLAERHPQAAEFLGKVRAEAQGALRKKPSATADKGDGK
jgi:hypothetical protein